MMHQGCARDAELRQSACDDGRTEVGDLPANVLRPHVSAWHVRSVAYQRVLHLDVHTPKWPHRRRWRHSGISSSCSRPRDDEHVELARQTASQPLTYHAHRRPHTTSCATSAPQQVSARQLRRVVRLTVTGCGGQGHARDSRRDTPNAPSAPNNDDIGLRNAAVDGLAGANGAVLSGRSRTNLCTLPRRRLRRSSRGQRQPPGPGPGGCRAQKPAFRSRLRGNVHRFVRTGESARTGHHRPRVPRTRPTRPMDPGSHSAPRERWRGEGMRASTSSVLRLAAVGALWSTRGSSAARSGRSGILCCAALSTHAMCLRTGCAPPPTPEGDRPEGVAGGEHAAGPGDGRT